MPNRALVLDANILIRAVLGIRVRRILETYADGVSLVVHTAPAVFTVDGAYAAALNQNGSINSASNPAPAGSIVAVWATGLGPVAPAQPDQFPGWLIPFVWCDLGEPAGGRKAPDLRFT